MCRAHLETLERSFSDLSALQINLERDVELNMRYSSAVSEQPIYLMPGDLDSPRVPFLLLRTQASD
jgi:hypothetical protein